MRFTIIVFITLGVVLIQLSACSRDDTVTISGHGITLKVPKEYVLQGGMLSNYSPIFDKKRNSFVYKITPIELIGISAPKGRLIHGVISITSKEEMSKIQQMSENIKQDIFEGIVKTSERFKNSVTEKAKYFDGYVIYENRDVKKNWIMLAKSPPKSKDDLIGSCGNLEFFNECRIYLYTQDQIHIELAVPEEVVGQYQEIVEAFKVMISDWKVNE